MKEGLGDILYFLAMIAFFVISSIAKSKKAKKKGVPPVEPVNYPDENEESSERPDLQWLNDVFKEEEEITPAPEQVTPTPPPAYENLSTAQNNIVKEAKSSKVSKKRELFKYSEVEGSESDGSYWNDEEFDLKRAIIFSEILKRPEL